MTAALPDLRAWLASGDAEALTLSREQVAALSRELQRLAQSADRLRKQNRKLRKRIAGARSAADGSAVAGSLGEEARDGDGDT